jgi:hypothetical protein
MIPLSSRNEFILLEIQVPPLELRRFACKRQNAHKVRSIARTPATGVFYSIALRQASA